jgi:hypothetical protein
MSKKDNKTHPEVTKYLEQWKDKVWSASRVSSFKDCPYNFYNSYILKNTSDNYFAYRGSAVHQIMEDYYNDIHQYKIPLQSLREHLVGTFEQMMENCPHEAVMYYTDKKGEVGKKAMNHNNISWSFMSWKPLRHMRYIEREVFFKVHEYNFRAFLDFEREYERLNPSGVSETVTTIGDYKSSWSKDKYTLQQYLYMYGKAEADGKKPAGTEIIEYKNGFKSVKLEYDEAIIRGVKGEVNSIIEDVKKALETDCFPKVPKDKFFCMNLCRGCEYGEI